MPFLRTLVLLCALAACAVCWGTVTEYPPYQPPNPLIFAEIHNLSSTQVTRMMEQYAEHKATLPDGITDIICFPEDGMIIVKGTLNSVDCLKTILTRREMKWDNEVYTRMIRVENKDFLLATTDERNPLTSLRAYYPEGIMVVTPVLSEHAIIVSAKSEEELDQFEALVKMIDTKRRNIVLEVQTVSMPAEIADSFGAPKLCDPPEEPKDGQPIDLASLISGDLYPEYWNADLSMELDSLLKARKAKRLFFSRLAVQNCEGISARLTADVKAAPLVISRVEVRDGLITVEAAPNQPKLPAFANLTFPTLRLYNGEMGVLAVDPDPANPANRLLLLVRATDAFDLPTEEVEKRDDKLKGSKK